MLKNKIIFLTFIFIVPMVFFVKCTKKEPAERKYLLERVGDFQVLQVYADGFEDLSQKEKILSYYLSMASLAGRDINYDQNHKHGLEIRKILEGIVTYPEGIEDKILAEIEKYTKLFWMNNGNYNFISSHKFVPEFIPEELLASAKKALANGADLGLKSGETIDEKLKRLEKTIFNINSEPVKTNKTPPDGQDIITGSANNLYEGVTFKEAENFDEKYPLNSRLVKINGKIIEEVYRAGTNGTPPGKYVKELTNVIRYLEKAVPYAGEKQQETLKHLIRYFKTGDPQDFRKSNISWVKDDPNIDTILGFIEVYLDARGIKAEYEGLVSYVNLEETAVLEKLAQFAQYFENKAPWDNKYKKTWSSVPVANAINVVMEVGGCGPISPAGINLPNAQDIREEYGSKNVSLHNIISARRAVVYPEHLDEFVYNEKDRELIKKYRHYTRNAFIALHEIVGHGSGAVNKTLKDDPSVYLKEYYSTLEEARADLVAMWNIFDDKCIEIGLVPDKICGEAMYKSEVMSDLTQLVVVKGDNIEEDHMRGTHLIVSYLRDNTNAIEVIENNGKIYFNVRDVKEMKEGIGKLLREIMRIKAEGDYKSAKNLIEKYAIKVNPEWRDQIQERYKKLNIPIYTAYVMPELVPVKDKNGNIIDIQVSYPMNLKSQMLKFSNMKF
ncbi:peptidase M49 [candidate division KSB1 bacterium]